MYGGGIDSYALLLHELACGNAVTLCYIRMGHKAQNAEMRRMAAVMQRHGLEHCIVLDTNAAQNIKHPLFGKQRSTTVQHADDYVPNRNLMLASLGLTAASRHNISEVAFAFNAGFSFPDATRAFVDGLNTLLVSYESPARCVAPLVNHSQLDIAAMVAAQFNSSEEMNRYVWSCYEDADSNDQPCHACAHCERNANLFEQLARKRQTDAT